MSSGFDSRRRHQNTRTAENMDSSEKKTAKSFGITQKSTIFAASNQYCGMRTAGRTSCLFCATTYKNKRVATPSQDDGNVPGVLAILDLTARSVVSLCQNQYCYVHTDIAPPGLAGVPTPEGSVRERVLSSVGLRPRHARCPSLLAPMFVLVALAPRSGRGGWCAGHGVRFPDVVLRSVDRRVELWKR